VREEQFTRYHLESQADAVEWTSALKVLLEQVPLQVDIPEMLRHWKWFGEWSIGCIGILSDWVVGLILKLSVLACLLHDKEKKHNSILKSQSYFEYF
jgi:hypothetical protein